MIRMQVYIPENLFAELKYTAKRREVSMAELIRKGIKKVVKIDEKKVDLERVFVAKAKWGKPTNAVDVVDFYYKDLA